MKAATHLKDGEAHLPGHVAVIMDGNGRWAKARGLPRTAGHKKGAETLRTLLTECAGMGIHYLTIYAFSSENWNRPESEVSDLMQLLRFYLEHERKTLNEHGIRLKVIGDLSQLDEKTAEQIEEAEAATAENDRLHLNVALSYGGRSEILHAIREIARDVQTGNLVPEAITETTVARKLYTQDIPDPDLLIRTGGEQRLSNFLLWQQAYTELYFTSTFWPDFGVEDFKAALEEYAKRERRYGTTSG